MGSAMGWGSHLCSPQIEFLGWQGLKIQLSCNTISGCKGLAKDDHRLSSYLVTRHCPGHTRQWFGEIPGARLVLTLACCSFRASLPSLGLRLPICLIVIFIHLFGIHLFWIPSKLL
jgi:hypothetical protein